MLVVYVLNEAHRSSSSQNYSAKLELPEQWKQANAPDYKVNKALLYVEHLITNNPNDQLRAEDLENEGGTGRKPSYKVLDNGSWVSTKECYEGDGDVIGIEEGTGDPTLLVTGTVFKQANDFNLQTEEGSMAPGNWSGDLKEYLTNAYYTTIDRDPFEWLYEKNDAGEIHEYIGSPVPFNDDVEVNLNVKLISGPRWRLKANKFGQVRTVAASLLSF
jgi:hypothetical protein